MDNFGLTLLLTPLFLFFCFCLRAFSIALKEVNKSEAIKYLKSLGNLFFYRPLHRILIPGHEYEGLQFANTCALMLARFGFVASATVLAYSVHPVSWIGWTGLIILIFSIFLIVGELIPKIIAENWPHQTLQFCAIPSSLLLVAALPWTYILLQLFTLIWKQNFWHYLSDQEQGSRQDIIDIIEEADIEDELNAHEKKLIESVVTFKDRIAREVMVPRVNVFSLKADTTIKEASKLLQDEGYSRIPVYRNSIDDIIGIMMYKDILAKYMECEANGNPSLLNAPIESIMKNVLYTPETTKISNLLQEFRKKQTHIAIVVDEYGGTEGIITIEDILEEIVGEIADEYDEEEETLLPQPDGSWIVDARMNIIDVEEQLGIKIPQEGEYDTIGGYIFHHADSIPQKGFLIKADDFEIEIIRSSERNVEKVRIKALHREPEEN